MRPIFGHPFVSYDFGLFSYGFALFFVDLIVGPRPIHGYFMVSYAFALCSCGFAMFLDDFNRRL